MRSVPTYIHQRKDWPKFRWDMRTLAEPLAEVCFRLGLIVGQTEALGFGDRQHTTLETLVLEVRKSSEIEDQHLDEDVVRSSCARRLGMSFRDSDKVDRHIEGVVGMVLDATQNHAVPLSAARLCTWHAGLFPSGYSSHEKILIAQLRKDAMEVVSVSGGRRKVHFKGPDPKRIAREMDQFIEWFEGGPYGNGILFAAVAHLWFVTIHPFDDGNGRLGRAVMDLGLSRAEHRNWRVYSMSAEIQRQRGAYYDILERTQKGDLDVTEYLLWFVHCLGLALAAAHATVSQGVFRARFWQAHAGVVLNDRQRKVVSEMLNSERGKLTNRIWIDATGCSHDGALRDMSDLVTKGLLRREGELGRTAGYVLADPADGP